MLAAAQEGYAVTTVAFLLGSVIGMLIHHIIYTWILRSAIHKGKSQSRSDDPADWWKRGERPFGVEGDYDDN